MSSLHTFLYAVTLRNQGTLACFKVPQDALMSHYYLLPYITCLSLISRPQVTFLSMFGRYIYHILFPSTTYIYICIDHRTEGTMSCFKGPQRVLVPHSHQVSQRTCLSPFTYPRVTFWLYSEGTYLNLHYTLTFTSGFPVLSHPPDVHSSLKYI